LVQKYFTDLSGSIFSRGLSPMIESAAYAGSAGIFVRHGQYHFMKNIFVLIITCASAAFVV
jgi:hypothetical protein